MKEEDVKLSYLAGIIDGEGTIGIFKHKQAYRITLKVANTSEQLIIYLHENFGGNKMGPYNDKKENHKDMFEWHCTSRKAIEIIEKVKPYLIVKNTQAALAIQAWEETFKNSYSRNGPNRIQKYVIDKREEYYQQMKLLNFRGKNEGEEESDKNKRKTQIISKQDVNSETKEVASCYLAGIIDGEGTIGIYKNSQSYQILLQVNNTSEELMTWLKWNFNGNLNGPYKEKKLNWKDRYEWRCFSNDAIKIVKNVEQYLIIKQEQANLAIDAWNNTFKISYRGRCIPKFATNKREQYRQQMNQLNMKGTNINKMDILVPFEIEKNTLKEWLK